MDLITFEAQGDATDKADAVAPPTADIENVCNYLDALSYSRSEFANPRGLPLSMRLLSETHLRLMRGVRGAEKLTGEVRRSQNWIEGSRPGNAMYVPPPPQVRGEVLGAFEKYLHADDTLPPLVRAGLLHVQFDTIQPYLDGNGRIGRLLVTLLLDHWKLLTKPLLYLSLFLKRHREDYYRRLNAVRVEGDWEGWLDFFLDGVATIADEAVASARELFAMKMLDTTNPTAGRAEELLVGAGVLVELEREMIGERLALEAVSEPPEHWPDAVRKRLREFAAVWNGLWPINRRRTLGTHFAAMTWHRKPGRLDVLPREPVGSLSEGA